MKKLLISALSLLFIATAFAQSDSSRELAAASSQPAKISAEKFSLRFCDTEVGGWHRYTTEDAQKVTAYIEISAERATQLAGSKVTGLNFSVAIGEDFAQGSESPVKGTIFIAEDLSASPVSELKVSFNNAYSLKGNIQSAQFTRTKQYVIKENTPFYFGFTIDVTAPIGIGYDKISADKDVFGQLIVTNNDVTTDSPAYEVLIGDDGEAHNMVLYATVENASNSTSDFAIGKIKISDWLNTTFNKENARPFQVEIANTGKAPITSIDYTYWFDNDLTVREGHADVNVAAATEAWVELPIEYPVGRSTAYICITKVGDTETNIIGAAEFFYLGESGYPAKFIVEKYTGQTCGYCPRGIYAFQWMYEHHHSDFMGVAIMNYNNDRYHCTSYVPFASSYFTGAPQCIINRMPGYMGLSYDRILLEDVYQMWKGECSNGNIELSISTDYSTISITSSTTFAIDDSHTYRIAYVLLEDGLVGTQLNNYANSKDPKDLVGEWATKSGYVPWTYEHVARDIKDPYGYPESVIVAPKAGQTYECSLTMSGNSLYNRNLKMGYVYAMLIDDTTGQLVTATSHALVEGGVGAVEDIEAADNAPAAYYTLQGIMTDSPIEGEVYIKVTDSAASKVVF